MKYKLTITLIILSLFFISCKNKTIVGKWQEALEPNGDTTYVEFTNDGHVIIYGKRIKPKYGTYTIDDTKTPAYLDITVDANNLNPSHTSNASTYKISGIYKFETNSLIWTSANHPDVFNIHPSDFSGNPKYITKRLFPYNGEIPPEYQNEYESPRNIETKAK